METSRQFYRTYPIANAVRSQLNWLQYRLFIRINNPDKHEYYLLEAVKNNWVGRQLERQINSEINRFWKKFNMFHFGTGCG